MSAEDAAPTSEDRRSSAKDVSEGRIDRLRSDVEVIEEDVPCSPEALKETLREGSGVVEEDRSVSALKHPFLSSSRLKGSRDLIGYFEKSGRGVILPYV